VLRSAARLVWIKRRWRCREPLCDRKTWTETCEHLDAQVVLTRRAGVEACRQVGELARPVSNVADELGVCWWTVMNAVIEHGTPLVDDPHRIGRVRQLGIDETSFLAANRRHATVHATGLVDLERHVVIDMVEGNSAADLRRWTSNAHPRWLAGIKVVATDLAESFRAGLSPGLDHARRVADPFHVVRVANRCLDQVRRRVQNETLGHRGRKRDPLYRIRKLLLTGNERLDGHGRDRMLLGLRVGDPHDEVVGAWLANYPALGGGCQRSASEGVRSRRWRWWSRLSITRVWRAVSEVQPRRSASSRSALMSSSCAAIAGTNSGVVVKFAQVSQMFA
jgi:transposase